MYLRSFTFLFRGFTSISVAYSLGFFDFHRFTRLHPISTGKSLHYLQSANREKRGFFLLIIYCKLVKMDVFFAKRNLFLRERVLN